MCVSNRKDYDQTSSEPPPSRAQRVWNDGLRSRCKMIALINVLSVMLYADTLVMLQVGSGPRGQGAACAAGDFTPALLIHGCKNGRGRPCCVMQRRPQLGVWEGLMEECARKAAPHAFALHPFANDPIPSDTSSPCQALKMLGRE